MSSVYVQRKAHRLVLQGRATITNIDPDAGTVEGTVHGDTNTYQTKVSVSGSFSCTCRWGDHVQVGSTHLCSHAEALKLVAGPFLGF